MTSNLTLRTLAPEELSPPGPPALGSSLRPTASPSSLDYRFRTRQCGDVVLPAATGARILAVLGLAASSSGVIAPEDAALALARLAEAIRRDDALAAAQRSPVTGSLGYQAWSLLGMLRVASASRERVVWST